MHNRRDFLQKAFGAAAFVGLSGIPYDLFAKKEIAKITILHTNDVHSHIDPFPDNDPKYPGMGGVARRAEIIRKIRQEEKNVLLLDAGDVFQGTPYFNQYGGELELKLMSMMGYDAGTIGNHDFDNGLEGFSKMFPFAQFPFINCNYDFNNTPLKGKTLPYKVFVKDDIRIGVFGIGIELEGLVGKKNYGDTVYLDPLAKAAEYTHLLKHEEKCDLVICLSHLGFRYDDKKVSDMVLAKKSKNIDLIIGGHTHTFLDKPAVILNRDGQQCLVAQVGWAGIKLGRVDFYFEKNSRKKSYESASVKISNCAIG